MDKSSKQQANANTLVERREFLGGAATLPYTDTGEPASAAQ